MDCPASNTVVRLPRSILPWLLLPAVLVLAGFGHAQAGNDAPQPGIGLFFPRGTTAALRNAARKPPCQAVYVQLLKQADAGLAKWPAENGRIAALAADLPDLTMEFVPNEFAPAGGKEAGKSLEDHALHSAPAAAFVYLLTGDRRYAVYAWEVFEQCGRVNRWGWFPWGGAHMPQIHFGMISRNLCLVADCVWDTLSDQQRRHARQVIAAKCVEPYYRIVLHTPGIGLYHLRSRNQGNNAIAAALIGSLFVGDAVPDNRIWFNSLLQTYHWAITHDIGWMGQGAESGIGGYWSVSLQNLYTAAAALHNVRGIDLRGHPGFEQATYYPLAHEVTTPGVGMFLDPIDPTKTAPVLGVIGGKPIELPGAGAAVCGPWWFDYAINFPETPAHYFAAKGMIGREQLHFAEAHQGALAGVLAIAWWNDKLLQPAAPPRSLVLFTDRLANLRSGYDFGDTCLYFNGDFFLSAKKEILGATSGMSWHFPWHQYQIAESGIETEGELFAPSMIIEEAASDEHVAFFRARSGVSNVAYYPLIGQRESYKHYEKRERSVLYLRGGNGRPDYFIFVDDVQHKEPRWHAWTWHLWNPLGQPKNAGRFIDKYGKGAAVRAERPNADLSFQFLAPVDHREGMAIEQHGIPGQPSVNYQMDHNVQMMRALAGGYERTDATPIVIPPAAWGALGTLQDNSLFIEKPPTEKAVVSQAVPGLSGGVRFRAALKCKEQDYRVYEATAWEIDLELLDAAGKVVAKPTTPHGHPHPLRLGAPASDLATHDWLETAQFFDAPADAVACRASFWAVGGAHSFKLGKLWLSPIELRPVGKPRRAKEHRFITVVMPLDKKASAPTIDNDAGWSHILHSNGDVDGFRVEKDGQLRLTRARPGLNDGAKVIFPLPPTMRALKTNSKASAKRLAAGLKPVLDRLDAERDVAGRVNLARGAKVTTSAVRDPRFAAAHVVDNETAEYPADGQLDYTLGAVESSGRFVGYGAGKESLLANRDSWPIYVRPTYWLLPEQQLGHVEIELPKAATVDRVRLLNTSNAGLNDFAAHSFRVELYGRGRKKLASKEGAFGKVFDRSFAQAFVVPKWFSRYTPSFAGMLEPGVSVPFGDGWQEINFAPVVDVVFVRVVITRYWGIGGGLNEVQVSGQ